MARKMLVVLHRLQTIRNAEQVMQHVGLKFLKPVAQLEAERLGAFDELVHDAPRASATVGLFDQAMVTAVVIAIVYIASIMVGWL